MIRHLPEQMLRQDQPPHEELSDDEIAAVLREVIAGAGRLPRHIDVYLAGVCAEHLVDGRGPPG